jgi:hypothetical protein
VRYERSETQTPEWFQDHLTRYMEHRLSNAAMVRIQRTDGTSIEAPLADIDGGTLVLDMGAGEGRGVHVQEIGSLTLVPERIDTSARAVGEIPCVRGLSSGGARAPGRQTKYPEAHRVHQVHGAGMSEAGLLFRSLETLTAKPFPQFIL